MTLDEAKEGGLLIGGLPFHYDTFLKQRVAILNYRGRYFQAETHEQALADAVAYFDSAGSAD